MAAADDIACSDSDFIEGLSERESLSCDPVLEGRVFILPVKWQGGEGHADRGQSAESVWNDGACSGWKANT